MTDVLLSIRPMFANAIIDGVKHVECRKTAPANGPGYPVWLYGTGTGTVIGKVAVHGIHRFDADEADAMWGFYGRFTALTHQEWCRYYDGTGGVLWLITHRDRVDLRSEPIPLSRFGLTRPPQSWRYTDGPEEADRD